MLTFKFSGASGAMTVQEVLTSGMVGKQMQLEFTDDWDGLQKTVVFVADGVTRIVINPDSVVTIPAEVLAVPYTRLYVGVCGTSEDGTLVIPTIMVQGPYIALGADPDGDPGVDPELPVWQQILNMIGDLTDLQTEAKTNLVAAINEAMGTGGGEATSPTVSIEAITGGTRVTITDVNGTKSFDVMDGGNGEDGAPGADGANGKSAYEYAKDGGYTGTEEEFAAKLAKEIPDAYTLTIATAETLGGVKPVASTEDMTQSVGVDENGGLWTAPGGGGSETPVTHSWNGTVLTITSASGTSSADLKGEKGADGTVSFDELTDEQKASLIGGFQGEILFECTTDGETSYFGTTDVTFVDGMYLVEGHGPNTDIAQSVQAFIGNGSGGEGPCRVIQWGLTSAAYIFNDAATLFIVKNNVVRILAATVNGKVGDTTNYGYYVVSTSQLVGFWFGRTVYTSNIPPAGITVRLWRLF